MAAGRQGEGKEWKERMLGSTLFFFQAEDGIRDLTVTGVQTCALPIFPAGAWTEYLDRMHTAGMPRVESRAADIRFTMDQLAKLDKNEDQTSPFAGRID